jgi:hypothetical protein
MDGFRAQALICLWQTRFALDERTSGRPKQVLDYKYIMLNLITFGTDLFF